MKTITGYPDDLTTYQRRNNALPLVKLALSRSSSHHTYYGAQGSGPDCRIIDVDDKETPYSRKVAITLENQDLALDGRSFKGYAAVLSYGLRTGLNLPVWQGNQAYALEDRIKPTVANGFRYKCIQAGVSADLPNEGEYYESGADNAHIISGNGWAAQTFTPSKNLSIDMIKVLVWRLGNPGTVTVSIQATDSNGLPLAPDLTSATFDGNAITTDSGGQWVQINFSVAANVIAGTQYAIVVRAPDGSFMNCLNWICDISSPTYSGGSDCSSSDSGSVWVASGYCCYFETWHNGTGTEPTWPTVIGDTVADNTVIWECEEKENDLYIEQEPLTVIGHEVIANAQKGLREHILSLQGTGDDLTDDKAMATYAPASTDTNTVKGLIEMVVAATGVGEAFASCKSYAIVWDADEDDDPLLLYQPKDGFRIYAGGTRMAALRRLLDYTDCAMKFNDGDIHIFMPVLTGEVYDYQYSLAKNYHTFFALANRQKLVIPNYIIVKSRTSDSSQYSGYATDPSYSLVEKRELRFASLQSNAQATDIAAALIHKAQLEANGGSGLVPMNLGQEIFDYISITDPKESETAVGNVGWNNRRYSVAKKLWELTFGFGGWSTTKGILDALETDAAAAGQSFERLSVGDLYAENITADSLDIDWIDPDGNIDLSKIGDNLDDLANGSTYGKVASIALDANGMVLLDAAIEGTYGLLLATDISSGHIKLTTNTIADGKWYDSAGVIIDSSNGIIIYGSATAFRTRATASGTDQCYMDSSGAICAGAGAVKLDASGLTIKGEALIFKGASGNHSSEIYQLTTGDLVVMPYGAVQFNWSNLEAIELLEAYEIEADCGTFSTNLRVPDVSYAYNEQCSLGVTIDWIEWFYNGAWHGCQES